MKEKKSFTEVSAGVWIRRLIVWSVTIVALIWAGHAVFRVFRPRPDLTPAPTVAPASQPLPTSTGEYHYSEAKVLLDEGRKALRSGDLKGLDTLKKITADHPTAPQARDALMVMAATYRFNAHEPQKAIEAYQDFIRKYPDDPRVERAVRDLQELAEDTKTPDNTEKILREVLPKLDNDPKARARVNAILEKMQQSKAGGKAKAKPTP